MKRILILWLAAAAFAASAMQAQPLKAGKLDRTSLVIAFYRSPAWAQQLQAKRAEQAEAKAANNTARAAELERWGQTSQELAHRQLSGEAPIDNILEALTPALPGFAQKASVSIIVVDLPYAASNVEIVDVTPLALDWLGADEKTRDFIRQTQKK